MMDKVAHSTVCMAIVVLAWSVAGDIGVSISLAILAGASKEAIDLYMGSGWSMYDLLADVVGIIAAISLIAAAGGV